MSKEYNLFISHSWTYSETYKNLTDLLDKRPYFNYRNYSIPKDDPVHTNGTDKALHNAIYNKMQGCHAVLILTGVYSTYSKWIGQEMKIAKKGYVIGPKPIIGINPWSQKNISSKVEENADIIVNWSTESIISAIRDYSL